MLLALLLGLLRFVPLVDPMWLVWQWPILKLLRPEPSAMAAGTLGLLVAALVFARHEIGLIATGILRGATGKASPGGRLLAQMFLASLPPALVLLAEFRFGWPAILPGPELLLATGFLVSGFAVLVADRIGFTVRRVEHLGYGGALLTGLFQAFAALPGLSQISVVIVAARLMDYERGAALRLGVLLAVPWLVIGTGLGARALVFAPSLLATALVAALAALVALYSLLKILRRRSFLPFALLQILAGAGLLWLWLDV